MIQIITEQYGPFWYFDERLVNNKFNYVENISSLVQELDRSKEGFYQRPLSKIWQGEFPSSMESSGAGIFWQSDQILL